jgi:hypothetical protein
MVMNDDISRARAAFDKGWHDRTVSPEERAAARQEYFELTDTDANMLDWEHYREPRHEES